MKDEKTIDEFEFYKELYHKENERRQEVINALNIPIIIVSGIITASFYYVTTFDYTLENFLNYIFIFFVFISAFILILIIYNMVRAYVDFSKGYEYSGIAYPQELFDWHQREKAEALKTDGNTAFADEYFKKYITENLVKHIDHNMYVNDSKYSYVYNAKRYIVACLISTIITLIPYGYNYFNKKEKMMQIELISNNNKIDSLIYTLNKNNEFSTVNKDSKSNNTIIIDQSVKSIKCNKPYIKKKNCCEALLNKIDSIYNNYHNKTQENEQRK